MNIKDIEIISGEGNDEGEDMGVTVPAEVEDERHGKDA